MAVVGCVASKFPRVLCRRWVSMSAVRRVFDVADERDFQTRVLESSKPVVVDFHAVWCKPCHTLGEMLEEEVGRRSGQVELARVDVDQLQELAIQYNVTAVPTVVGVRGGKVKDRFVGAQEMQFIKEFLHTLDSSS